MLFPQYFHNKFYVAMVGKRVMLKIKISNCLSPKIYCKNIVHLRYIYIYDNIKAFEFVNMSTLIKLCLIIFFFFFCEPKRK